ncbi:Ras/Rap GTPase-activating protein SynGAP [Clarias magur]|uniref:Ras/Rap GTPase-activating protein SynGAP n=1 Tax=Clarias magur TaxID=1594786 RepID=A0A8J4T9H8_CLAMG|nr:Ras/Rap GTPase-activating protein SynGAP [Clarias magur]
MLKENEESQTLQKESVSDQAGRVQERKVHAIRRSMRVFDRFEFTSTKTAIASSEEKNPAASIIHSHTVACNGNAERQRPTVA